MAGRRAQKSRTNDQKDRTCGEYTARLKPVITNLLFGPPERLFLLASDAQRTGSAHRVLEQLESDNVADLQVVERRPLAQVTPVEVDLAIVAQSDEAVAQTYSNPGYSTGRGAAGRIGRPDGFPRTFCAALPLRAVEMFSTHMWSLGARTLARHSGSAVTGVNRDWGQGFASPAPGH